MKEQEIYYGFSSEKQADYEKQLIQRFGDKVKDSIAESHQNVKNWSKSYWDKSNKEFDAICKELTKMIEKHSKENSEEVQNIIHRHYLWLKQFWTPTKKSYTDHGQLVIKRDLRETYAAYHPQLPEFIAEAIQTFSKLELA